VAASLEAFLRALKKDPELLRSQDVYKPEYSLDASQGGYELFLAAFLHGMADAGGSDEYADQAIPEPLNFEEATAFARGRVSLSRKDYYSLSDRMRAKAWTVGRLSQLDAIERVKQHYVRQLDGSQASLTDFIESVKLDDMVSASGWAEGSPWYYETVYRTNVMTDYNAGRAYQLSQNKPVAMEFVGIEDSRQTDICAKRTGIILPYTDPWWDANWPPLHFGCRSTVRAIYREEAEVLGLDIPELVKDSKPMIAEAGSSPGNGFGTNPVADNQLWNLTPAQQARISAYMIQDELNGVIGQTICKDFSRKIEGYTNVEVARGGVRYPDELVQQQEFSGNLQMSKIMAEKRGVFVELRAAEKLNGNTQFDASVNGIERWEYKHLISSKKRTLSEEIRKSATQAPYLFILVDRGSQVNPLAKALQTRAEVIAKEGRKLNLVLVSYKEEIRELTWNDLIDGIRIREILTSML
jgi:SPP1 gp7 family putative phage head morphogenesis protein